MKTSVIITEFNPLHCGHEYFIRKVRELSGSDYIIAVMSGDYVQRGEPALFNKYVRTASALQAGADLVLELPVRYALGDAGSFSSGAVAIMNALGCADELWFGSESGDMNAFEALAGFLAEESVGYKNSLLEELKKGLSYPAAREAAVKKHLGEKTSSLLSGPNNVLGLEYCIAAKKSGSAASLHTIRRKGSGYNDTVAGPLFASAAAVRKEYLTNGIAAVRSLVPSYSYDLIHSEPGGLMADDFSLLLKYRLLRESPESLTQYNEVSSDLARRIKNLENSFTSLSDFALQVKTRNITCSHVCRALFSILLEIKKEETAPPFARVLGMKDCGPLIRQITSFGKIRLLSKASDIHSGEYSADLFASDLYESVKADKFGFPFIQECERKFIKL